MHQSICKMKTAHGSKYLAQMCRYFGQTRPVAFDSCSGMISFPFGSCQLSSETDSLSLCVSGDDLTKLEQLIASHLERFAFLENLQVTWQVCAPVMTRTGGSQTASHTQKDL